MRCAMILLLVVGTGACGSDARSLGTECDEVSQCEAGLSCLANFVAGQCTATKTCTKVCTGNADCQSVDPKGMCFQGCGADQICMLTP